MGFIQKIFGFGREDERVRTRIGASPFDKLRREDERGEYWSARELANMLGYGGKNYTRDFLPVVEDAKKMLQSPWFPGVDVRDHFLKTEEMVPIGSGAHREVEDIRLSRLACWAVSLSADGKRSGVAEAKRYFMESTRAMEILRDNPALSRKIRKWSALGRDWDWIDKRYKGQFVRRAHTEALKEAGVMPGYGHATCADTINLEVLGQPARKIREERGVKDTRDGLDHVEVVSIMFAETMATRRIERHQSRGIQACKADCKVAGENTRRALDDSLAPRSIA